MKSPYIPRKIAILGATSGMAEKTARLLAADHNTLMLVARNEERLSAIASDLDIRGNGDVLSRIQDLELVGNPSEFFKSLASETGGLDAVLIFHGYLGDQSLALTDATELDKILSGNFVSTLHLSIAARQVLENSQHDIPVLLAIGSVAGDRGRSSNYLYGCAKSAICTLFEGMMHNAGLSGSKTSIILVKAGLTDSPMTAHLPKDGLLWSSTDKLAQIIAASMDKGSRIVYAPGYWRIIMWVIRMLPQSVLNRLNL
ncbi:MAG: SDR family NAD(P)-dependent oxidoreductase [Granulosicoccus sp.]